MLLLALLLAVHPASADTTPRLRVRSAPERPWVERDPSSAAGPQYLNFDLLVDNPGTSPRTLSAARLSAYDSSGRLLLQRFCDGSGISPCHATLPDREVAPGGSAIIYNPFHTLPGDLRLAELRYELVYTDSTDTPIDTLRITLHPVVPPATPALRLPVTGRLLVFDGHDYTSHHRRWNLAHPIIRMVGFTGNSGRYAYDLSRVDSAGRMFRGDGSHNSDWYSWEAPVRAPSGGVVVASSNDQPDWEVGRTSLPDTAILHRPIALYGNYVIIDHGQGAFSLIAHLRQGSVPLRSGDRVAAGQFVGKVGFSGSVYTIHTHYQLQSGAAYSAEGLPSYFVRARRIGTGAARTGPIRIDSGDLVESR